MSCVEKRHMSHRMGSMLHHRFPNGFSDLFMDETDREVSTLTDRAFRSLCIGDDAVYNDEFLYAYSPFSCHKPVVGDPLKNTHRKESKKQGRNKKDKNNAQPWKQQQQKNISNMSSFLKALSATEKSCEGMLIKNGGMTDSNGESWDKSALRSIQRELSEFSGYHANLRDGHYKNHHLQHSGGDLSNKTGKGAALPSGKSSNIKNGKTTVKLKKLNIKNFFLHSEFSPFQTWRDFNRFPFGQEKTVTSILPTDSIPKWYDLPFYKELTDAHRKDTLHTVESQLSQKAEVEPPPPIAPKPVPPPPPPKVLPKPTATPAEKRCSSDVGDGIAAPWRRNRSRATSAVPVNQPGIPSQDNISKTVDESVSVVKKEPNSVEVKAIEEVSSLASTPFSICQLMTPLIPSRQATDTSEILQAVLSPSALDLPLRPHSEAKLTPEPPVKRDGYKSLASSILFNIKDNRKRVKSRYSPPKFKTLDPTESGNHSLQSDHVKHSQADSEGTASGFSTPAILRDGQTVCSPILELADTPTVSLTKHDTDRPRSDDYLLSNLLQSKKEVAGSGALSEENPIPPLIHSKKNKSPKAKKQNYPSLHLYRKASPDDSDMRYLQVPPSSGVRPHTDQSSETNEPSILMLNKQLSPTALPTNTGLSLTTSNASKDHTPITSPHVTESEKLSSKAMVGKTLSNVPDKAKLLVKNTKEKEFEVQPVSKEKESSGQTISTMDVIRAAREAINATKNKALSAAPPEGTSKQITVIEETEEKETDERVTYSKEMVSSKSEIRVPDKLLSKSRNESTSQSLVGKNSHDRKEPPPVPKRHFSKSDIEFAFEKHHTLAPDVLISCDSAVSPSKEDEFVSKQGKAKHNFSARQNNYIKNQRCAGTDNEEVEKRGEWELNVGTRVKMDEKMSMRETRDSEHIINDLNALKELQRAKLGDRILENAKKKIGANNIDEEARAKNDLISRELRNIKKGMLSMRGNTSAKRDIFAKKEKEQRLQETFSKTESNVMVNKALRNDNYDKAKMALEEIISEREKRRVKSLDDENPMFGENASDESYVTGIQKCKNTMNDSQMEMKEKQNGSTSALKENDLKDRLSDLRDHNHVRQILAQTEPRLGETHRLGGRIPLPGMDRADNLLTTKAKHVNNRQPDDPSYELEEMNFRHVARQMSEDSGESLINEMGGKPLDAPPVPPRSRKGGNRRDDGVDKEINTLNDAADEDVFNKAARYENSETCLSKICATGAGKQEIDNDLSTKEAETISDKDMCSMENNANSKYEPILSEHSLHLSVKLRGDESEGNNLQSDFSPTRETEFETPKPQAQEMCKIKRKAPLRPDHLIAPDDKVSKSVAAEDEAEKINKLTEEVNVAREAVSETPRSIISPLLMVNGVSTSQSPPDQGSLSSKSSYFSVDSTLHRNTETESNVYHSLETLIGDLEGVEGVQSMSPNMKTDADRTERDHYPLSDYECEPEFIKQSITSPQKETEAPKNDNKSREYTYTHHANMQTPLSPTNSFSPNSGIPSLFKIKDNTVNVKTKKTVQPWALRSSLAVSQREEEELHQAKRNPVLPHTNETDASGSTISPAENSKPIEIPTNHLPPPLPTPSNIQNEKPKNLQAGQFLTVPQEEDSFSGVSPSSEGMESTADTMVEVGRSTGVLVEPEVSKVPSECSGSNYSGNDSQPGLPKPPAVLPKSEKAVLKAIKLTNRRMKKEEAQNSSQKSSQSSSKHRTERPKGDKSEQKSSSSRNSKSSERKHREKMEDGHHHRGTALKNTAEQIHQERRGQNGENHHQERAEVKQNIRRQSLDGSNVGREALLGVAGERQGRTSDRHIRDKSRHYSIDRVISNVPVYKAQVSERLMTDRPLNRSQSIDRYLGDKVERRFSADMSVNDPRSQRIEKSIIDGLHQRGRARDKASRDNPVRRSQSIDAYGTEVTHPSTLSRQSSLTSQLSRQSSMDHTIVTQSFPVTQRKLLQDPDSGQYFVVDMPVQIKTKTFFDPETGSYVQLPVQPPDGAIPQPSPIEVLTPPLVVYHSFVPVPLSPMAQNTTIQTAHAEPEDFEQRLLERSRQMHCKEGHPYLEPVFSQHDHILGEFVGTEELDCPS